MKIVNYGMMNCGKFLPKKHVVLASQENAVKRRCPEVRSNRLSVFGHNKKIGRGQAAKRKIEQHSGNPLGEYQLKIFLLDKVSGPCYNISIEFFEGSKNMALKERQMLREKPVLKMRKPFSQSVLVACPSRCVTISGEVTFHSGDISKLKEKAYEKQRSLLWEARIDAGDE